MFGGKWLTCPLRPNWQDLPPDRPRSPQVNDGLPVSSNDPSWNLIQHVFSIPVAHCGTRPRIINGFLMEMTQWYLRYQCPRYYKLEGPDQVNCLASGSWSQVPVCKREYQSQFHRLAAKVNGSFLVFSAANFCYLNTAMVQHLENIGLIYLEVGQRQKLQCMNWGQWYTDHFTMATCTAQGLTYSKCEYNVSVAPRHRSIAHRDVFFPGCSWVNPLVSDGNWPTLVSLPHQRHVFSSSSSAKNKNPTAASGFVQKAGDLPAPSLHPRRVNKVFHVKNVPE